MESTSHHKKTLGFISINTFLIIISCGYFYRNYYEHQLSVNKSQIDGMKIVVDGMKVIIEEKDAHIERLKTTVDIADKEISKLPERMQDVERVAKDIAATKKRVENYEATISLIAKDSATIRTELSNSLSSFQTKSDVVMSNIRQYL